LCFQFPNWSLQLPGYGYSGNDPHGFSRCDEITQFIVDYARFIDAPVRCGVNVTALERESRSGRFLISTDDSVIEASSVVIATGPFQRPLVPAMTLAFPPAILQLHASRYVEPGQLPDGAVFVVGSGSSGCQIAQELNEFGRTVYLSVGRHRRAPRRYRGHDLLWWAMRTGRFDVTVDRLPDGRTPPTIILTGIRGGSDMNVRTLSANGVVVLGRPTGISGSRLTLKDDAELQLAQADAAAREFTESVDAFVQKSGIDAPAAEPADEAHCTPWERIESEVSFDLNAAGVTTVIWCTGYRYEFDWVRLPIFDEQHQPVQNRGVTSCPGAYVVGLHWMHKYTSGTLFGVGEDAAYIAQRIASRSSRA
jgi:putative flavoprotein involved in K+ transport